MMGVNSIMVTASDVAGNVGRDTITVTRIPDTTPPTVVSVSPQNGATLVGINASVSVTFSEPMDPLSVSATTITLMDSANNLIAAAVTYDAPGDEAVLAPLTLLAANTTYKITITTGVHDAAGNPLANLVASSFTTAP